ncbi:ATP-binding protein [Streptomyces erythrochromogenes]|uniref:ATP-binding protein n=1 Tax=Streptomyces erythrochromogenes TaxID=285574 RepID=UPI0037F465BA
MSSLSMEMIPLPVRRRSASALRAVAADGLTEPGSGLGLAIATAIATVHGGRLELDNRPGEGSAFRLLLPHQPPPPHVPAL